MEDWKQQWEEWAREWEDCKRKEAQEQHRLWLIAIMLIVLPFILTAVAVTIGPFSEHFKVLGVSKTIETIFVTGISLAGLGIIAFLSWRTWLAAEEAAKRPAGIMN